MDRDNIKKLINEIEEVYNDYTFENNVLKLNIKFKNITNDLGNPTFAKNGDSGFDFRANIEEPITIKPLERCLISTGLFFEIPKGFELQVRPRSGLAIKNGITVLNSPGTVDSGYRGEVKVILINLSNEDFVVERGDRIAQGVIQNVQSNHNTLWFEMENLSESDRGDNGFGSTKVK